MPAITQADLIARGTLKKEDARSIHCPHCEAELWADLYRPATDEYECLDCGEVFPFSDALTRADYP